MSASEMINNVMADVAGVINNRFRTIIDTATDRARIMEKRLDEMDERIGSINGRIIDTMTAINNRANALSKRVDEINERIDIVNARIDAIQKDRGV